jgi:nucleoside-diphosphate-sugar epimerase
MKPPPKTTLITGGAGFLGTLLKKSLLKSGHKVISIDLQTDPHTHPNFTAIQGDIRNKSHLTHLATTHHITTIFHLAAQMPHAVKNRREFWATNVTGTQNIAEIAKTHHINQVIFTSTNCLYGKSFTRPIRETDPPTPTEIYGQSKIAAEKILTRHKNHFHHIIFRCPPIIDDGRAGNIAILFDFIHENRKLWLVGKGDNRYQLLYARDLITAMLLATNYKKSATFGIGADNIPTFRETYEYLIKKSKSTSRPASLPTIIVRPIMKTANALGLSPLGPYFQAMIDQNFAFDTTNLKKELGWHPTLNNSQMLLKAYTYYTKNKTQIKTGATNNTKAKMGIIRLLKWLS